MTKLIINIALSVVAITAIAALWLRIRQLENSVASLTRELKAKTDASVVEVRESGRPLLKSGKTQFKLIEGAHRDRIAEENGNTEIGVPWSVERAMMGDANQNSQRFRDLPGPETEIEQPPQFKIELQFPMLENGPVPSKNNGGFN